MSEALRKTGGKLLVLILIAGLTFAVAAVLSTVEASAANQHFKVTTTAGLNMRSSTSTSSSVLKKIRITPPLRLQTTKLPTVMTGERPLMEVKPDGLR